MAKIAIDLTPLYDRPVTGLEVYGISLYRAILKTPNEIFPIFRIQNTLDNNKNSIIIPSKSRIITENILLTNAIKRLNPDIVLFPIFPPPLNCYKLRCKIIPTIHDLAFKKYSNTLSLKARLYLTPKYNKALKNSFKILTISDSVKSEIEIESKVPVVNLGNEISNNYKLNQNVFDDNILTKFGLIKNQYVISVSTIEPRKNMKYLFEIWNDIIEQFPGYKLVLAGRKGWGTDNGLNEIFSKIEDSIIFTGFVDQSDLINLYHYANTFILLSLYEGFGRTPLEGLACGTKVAVSDIPIFRETLNDVPCAVFLPLGNRQKAVQLFSNFLNISYDNISCPERFFNSIEENVNANLSSILEDINPH